MIYLNNGATSYPKPDEVVCYTEKYLKSPRLGGGRSSYSEETEDVVYECRKALSELFNIEKPELISFTSGATQALNMVIQGLDLKNAHVITTAIEHTSMLRPLKLLEKKDGLKLSIVDCDENGLVNPNDIQTAIESDTKAIFVNHASNVIGAVTNIRKIADIAHEENIIIVVDASQSAGCIPIDVKSMDIDVLIFTGHKSLYGIEGIGGVYIREGINIEPLMVGGTGIKSNSLYQSEERPAYYEAGTQNIVGIASLKAGVSYILKNGIDNINKLRKDRFFQLYEGLEKIPIVQVFGKKQYTIPVISFNIKGMNPQDVGYLLGKDYDIIVRTGLLCAPLIHEKIGTAPFGAVRISFSHFTSNSDILTFLTAVDEIAGMFMTDKIKDDLPHRALTCL